MAQQIKDLAVVTAVAQVHSLAPELLHAAGAAKKKKKKITQPRNYWPIHRAQRHVG